MQSVFHKTADSSIEEEQQPILPGRTNKRCQTNHFVFKIIYGALTVTVCALLISTIHQSTQFTPDSNNSIDAETENSEYDVAVDYNSGALRQSYNGEGSNRKATFQNGDTNQNQTGPVVKIESGEIRGIVKKSRDGRDYFAFHGIPYAEPPVGQLRFQPPQPFKAKWSGIRDGTNPGDEQSCCIQFTSPPIKGTEDCLKLQVFTPKLPRRFGRRNPKLPVMFYILGGAYLFGRANRYGAEYMMDEDVILVLIDFRYGAFGHLNTEDLEIRGNQAFKDQVMALKWVQKNIKKFGGDPKKVLIFGNSSGAASVHAHIISSMSDGLFSRAVSQSGTVVLPPEHLYSPLETARLIGTGVNCTNVEDTKELHQCLLEADAYDIGGVDIPDMHYTTKETVPADGDLSQVFMPDLPINLLKEGKFKKDIPWILGGNSAESYFSANLILQTPSELEFIDKNWNDASPALFEFKDDHDTHQAAKNLRELYFGSKPFDQGIRYNLTNLLSDIKWLHPVKVAGDYHAKYGAKGYFYLLEHEPVSSYGDFAKEGFSPPYGVAHADEVQLFFPFAHFPYISSESRDYNFSKTIIKIWTDFARTGIPSVPNLKEWPPLPSDPNDASAVHKWLAFNDTSQLMEPLSERMTFLDSFPFFVPELYGPKVSVQDAIQDAEAAHVPDIPTVQQFKY